MGRSCIELSGICCLRRGRKTYLALHAFFYKPIVAHPIEFIVLSISQEFRGYQAYIQTCRQPRSKPFPPLKRPPAPPSSLAFPSSSHYSGDIHRLKYLGKICTPSWSRHATYLKGFTKRIQKSSLSGCNSCHTRRALLCELSPWPNSERCSKTTNGSL